MIEKPRTWAPYGDATARPKERYVDEAAKPHFSGLYDAHGVPLYRQPNPVGFETDPSRKFGK